MLSGAKPKVAGNVENIEIFTEHPQRQYHIIAMINSSADTQRQLYGSSSMAESNALEELKKQAAAADGVIDIKEEVFENGKIVSSAAW